MSSPKTHTSEVSALETVKKLHKGHTTISSKLLIAHVVEGTIKILESAKSTGLKAEVNRLENANQGLKLNKERKRLGGIISDIAKDIGTKSETEIKKRISDLEKTNETIIGASVDLIVQLANLKRAFKKHTSSGKPKPSPRPKPTPVPPPAPHTPPVAPNIIGSKHIVITSLPPSESITGGVNAGETLMLSRDGGTTWSTVATNPSNNFDIKITERTNGTYPYRLKTKNAAGVESGEETVIVEINVVTLPVAPEEPTLTSTDYTIDPPEIEGRTTPNVVVELTVNGGTYTGRSNASGVFRIKPTSSLGNGTHRIQVIAKNGSVASTTLTEDITLRKVLNSADLRSFTITSLKIEQGEPKPSLNFKNLKEGTRITILDATGRHEISDPYEVTSGTTDADIDLLTISTEYPSKQAIRIRVEDIHGSQPPYIDKSKKIEVEHKKIDLISARPSLTITNEVDTEGRIPFGSKIAVDIKNIPKGAGLRIKKPSHRLPGATDFDLGHWQTEKGRYTGELDQINTKKGPFDTAEELVIEMYDPNNLPIPGVEIGKVDFEIAQKEAPLNQTTIQPPTGKIKNVGGVIGDAIFKIGRPNNDTEIVVEPSIGTFDVASLTPPEIRIKPTSEGKHSYTFYIRDKNHPGKPRELLQTYEVEVEHPELTLIPPTVPTTPLIAIQPVTRPTVHISSLAIGSEVTITGPHGELAKFKARSTSATVPLNKLDISNIDPQNITVTVTDPNHPNTPAESSVFQVDVKKKVEAPKHLPQPVFKVPVDYYEGKGDITIELTNAVTNSEVTVEYDTGHGHRSATHPLTITADGAMNISLPGFDAPAGTSNIVVKYTDPTVPTPPGRHIVRPISMNVGPRPSIERPEGFQDEVDITTKPTQIKVGKLKPGQTMVVAHSDGSTPPLSRGTDGTHTFPIPANMCSEKQIYTVTVTDTSGATENFPLTVNVKIPPKANRRIDHHNFVHACEEAKKHGTGHYRINGEAHPFDVTKGWGKYKTTIHGENFKAKTPDELFKIVKKHLDHENQHEKDEYNAYWGLMPESSDHDKHKPGDHDEKDNGKKKDHTGDEKGGHGDHGSESKGGKFIGAIKAVGKTAAWPAAGALAGLGYATLYSGGAVFLGPAVGFGATIGAGIWAIRKLWQIKNGTKGGDSGAHH